MTLSFAVAMSTNRVIGINNQLPWKIPEDLKKFKEVTSGHPVLMGRKTYESIGRLLPGRTNIIITRNRNYRVEGAAICGSLEEAIILGKASPGGDEIIIIGGGELFQQGLALVDRLHLTIVDRNIPGDTFFPEFDPKLFREISKQNLTHEATYFCLERAR